MENILEKSFTNSQLGIKLNSYIDEECNVFFKAKEVAQILGYKNTEDAIKRHVSENNKIKKVQHRETRGCTFTFYINEPGFYELVFKSRLPCDPCHLNFSFVIIFLSYSSNNNSSTIYNS